MLTSDVGNRRFTHCHGFTDEVVADRAAFPLQGGFGVGVYIVMVGIDAIEIASDAILIASQRGTDHILAGQTAT